MILDYEQIIVEKHLSDDEIKHAIQQIWQTSIEHINIDSYPYADWEQLNKLDSHIVCQILRMRKGLFHTLLALTFIKPSESGMKTYEIAIQFQKIFKCKTLIESGISIENYILIKNTNDLQHVFVNLDYIEYEDKREYHVIKYGQKVQKREIEKFT